MHRVMYGGWVVGDHHRFNVLKLYVMSTDRYSMSMRYDVERNKHYIERIRVSPFAMVKMLERGILSVEESHQFTAFWEDTGENLPEDKQLFNAAIQTTGWGQDPVKLVVNKQDLASHITVAIYTEHSRWYDFKYKLGLYLVKIGTRIAGLGYSENPLPDTDCQCDPQIVACQCDRIDVE